MGDSEDELVTASEMPASTSNFALSAGPVVEVIEEPIEFIEVSAVCTTECSRPAPARPSSRPKHRKTKRTIYRMDMDEVIAPARDSSLARSYDSLGAQFYNLVDNDDMTCAVNPKHVSLGIRSQGERASGTPVKAETQQTRMRTMRCNSGSASMSGVSVGPTGGRGFTSSPSGRQVVAAPNSFGIVKLSKSCGRLPTMPAAIQVAMPYSDKSISKTGRTSRKSASVGATTPDLRSKETSSRRSVLHAEGFQQCLTSCS